MGEKPIRFRMLIQLFSKGEKIMDWGHSLAYQRHLAIVGGTSNDGHVEVANSSLGGNGEATYETNATEVTSSYVIVMKVGTSTKNMEVVLLNGPWMICTIPMILKTLLTSVCLAKENLRKILVWVKLHDVPTVAYAGNGLSMIALKL
nr:hypothetical protein [Tanacetum cinerariifolium]